MPDSVKQDAVVSVQYKLYLDDDDTLIEESEADDPLMYLHGHQNIIDGLENALEDMSLGESKVVRLNAAAAYGEYDSEAVQVLDRDQLPDDLEPEEGMLLQIVDEGGDGASVAEVIEVTKSTITLDFNHPLAGENLRFEVEVVGLRDATPEELDHGHVHGPDGHEH